MNYYNYVIFANIARQCKTATELYNKLTEKEYPASIKDNTVYSGNYERFGRLKKYISYDAVYNDEKAVITMY